MQHNNQPQQSIDTPPVSNSSIARMVMRAREIVHGVVSTETKTARHSRVLRIESLEEKTPLDADGFDIVDLSDESAYVSTELVESSESAVQDVGDSNATVEPDMAAALDAIFSDRQFLAELEAEAMTGEEIESDYDALITQIAEVVTADRRVEYFNDKAIQSREIIADIENRLTAARTDITERQEQISANDTEIREQSMVSPIVRVKTPRRNNTIYINARKIGEPLRVVVFKNGTVYRTQTLSITSPSANIRLPRGGYYPMEVRFYDPETGQQVGQTRQFSSRYGMVLHTTNQQWQELIEMAAPLPIHQLGKAVKEQIAILQNENDSLQNEIVEFDTEISNLTQQKEDEQLRLDEYERQHREAVRETIPYARMRVESINQNRVTIRFRSNQDNVRFTLNEGPNIWGTAVLHNEGGFVDKTFEFHPPADRLSTQNHYGYGSLGYQSIAYELKMTGEDGTVLDCVFVGPLGEIYTKQDDWEHLDEGRMVENPVPYDLKLVEIHGNNIMFAINTPEDDSIVELDGGGMLSSEALMHEGGTTMKFGIVTFNARNESGEYHLKLRSSSGGMVREEIRLSWDKGSGTLTVADDDVDWITASDLDIDTAAISDVTEGTLGQRAIGSLQVESAQIIEAQQQMLAFEKQMLLSTIGFDSNPTLAAIVHAGVASESRFYFSADEIHRRVHEKYDGVLAPVAVSDIIGSQVENLGIYLNSVGELLNEAANIFIGIRNGGNEIDLRDQFQWHHNNMSIIRKIRELSEIGIHLPSVNDLIAEGRTMYFEHTNKLLHAQSEQDRLRRIDAMRAGMASWQIDNDESGSLRAQQAMLDLRKLVARADAENGYVGRLSDSEARRLGRAQRLVELALSQSNDPRVLLALQQGATAQTIAAQAGRLGLLPVDRIDATIAEYGDELALLETGLEHDLASGEDVLITGVLENGLETPQTTTGSLDRWWATAGVDQEMDMTWRISVAEDGQYRLYVRGVHEWEFSNKVVEVSGGTMSRAIRLGTPLSGHASDLVNLTAGDYTIRVHNIGVPTTPTVEDVEFTLMREDTLANASNRIVTKMIADREEIDVNRVFNIVDENGNYEALSGVQQLIEKFSPILHFAQGERYAVPFAVDRFYDAETNTVNMSGYQTGEYSPDNVQPTIYASVAEDTARGEIAINYHFFYPRSNWSEYPSEGYNTHEGDWEGATVFLRQTTDGETRFVWIPDRVVVAQHIRRLGERKISDGGEAVQWNDLGLSGTHPNLYVGLGGHATYTFSGISSMSEFDHLEDHRDDLSTIEGVARIVYLPPVPHASASQQWLRYTGNWGSEDLDGDGMPFDGDTAPSGPAFAANGFDDGLRWLDPWNWDNLIKNPENE